MVRAHGLVKSFPTGWLNRGPRVPVLQGFDFEAPPGQVTGLIGRNGSGKTTFFRGLVGLETFEAGTVTVDGIDAGQSPEALRGRIALLPEDPGVEGPIAGKRHLELFGTSLGLGLPRLRALLERAEASLELGAYWTRPFAGYSRGQKARIALARLQLFDRATTFVFDEPSNGLDFESTARLHRFIRSLAQDGKTVIVSSHILNDLQVLCDRIVGLRDGVAATPAQIQAWMDDHAQRLTPEAP